MISIIDRGVAAIVPAERGSIVRSRCEEAWTSQAKGSKTINAKHYILTSIPYPLSLKPNPESQAKGSSALSL